MAKEKEGSPKAGRFYSRVLKEAEALLLEEAQGVEGVDQEVALLRVKLIQALREHPQDYSLLLKLAQSLARMVALQYRTSRKAEEDLYQSVVGVLKGVGGLLFPDGLGEVGDGEEG